MMDPRATWHPRRRQADIKGHVVLLRNFPREKYREFSADSEIEYLTTPTTGKMLGYGRRKHTTAPLRGAQ